MKRKPPRLSATHPIPSGRGGYKTPPSRSDTSPICCAHRGGDKNPYVAERHLSWKVWVWALVILLTLIMVYGCTVTKYVPVNQIRHETIIERDTVFEVVTPEEVVVNSTTDTVSELHTTYAHSVAKVEGGVLTHSLTQPARKDSAKGKQRIVYVVDSIPYAVSGDTVVKEVVPTWCWWSLVIAGVCIAGCTLYIIGNIKKE